MAPRIEGLAEAMRILKQFEPDSYKEMQKRMKSDAKPMLNDAKARLPQVPLSNWRGGRNSARDTGGYKTLRGGSVNGKSGFPVYEPGPARKRVKLSLRNQKVRGTDGRRVVFRMISDDASAMIFDRAGKKTASTFEQNLTRKWGGPMRALWPAAEVHRPGIVKGIEAALREQEKKTNRKLR